MGGLKDNQHTTHGFIAIDNNDKRMTAHSTAHISTTQTDTNIKVDITLRICMQQHYTCVNVFVWFMRKSFTSPSLVVASWMICLLGCLVRLRLLLLSFACSYSTPLLACRQKRGVLFIITPLFEWRHKWQATNLLLAHAWNKQMLVGIHKQRQILMCDIWSDGNYLFNMADVLLIQGDYVCLESVILRR